MTTLKPFLTVNNGNNAVKFYQAAFDAKENKRWEKANGTISSVLEIENTEFYVADEEPENGNFIPHASSNNSIKIILNTTNADSSFEKAINLDAEVICPMTTEDSWRIGKLRDPFGHIWEIGFEL